MQQILHIAKIAIISECFQVQVPTTFYGTCSC